MSGWQQTAADRVAALREQSAAAGEPVAELSDLELLNTAYESVLREQIDTRDRYMGLLTGVRKHDDAVRDAAARGLKGQAERYARAAVAQYMSPYSALLYRIEKLPDRPGPVQMEGMRRAAEMVRTELRFAPERPEELLDPEGARHTLRMLRHVVGVLDEREDLEGAEVLWMVKAALDDESLLDLFAVADTGTPKPRPPRPDPPFAGPGWRDLGSLWAYQPDDGPGAHVKAYAVGDDWYLDLWSASGQLLTFGTAPASEVAALAPALLDRADDWACDRSGYAWRRFDTAQTALAGNAHQPGGHHTAPDREPEAQVALARAATATSPNQPTGIPTTAPGRTPAAAFSPQHAAPRRSR